MKSFFDGIPLDEAELIESLSRASYELRENRKLLLEQYGVADEAMLLERISAGDIPEHPAYEHYLSARILAETQEAVRNELATIALEVNSA